MTEQLNFGDAGLGRYGDGDFEVVVQVRNYKGEPTGRTKSLRSDDPNKIAEFFSRMTGKPKRGGNRHKAQRHEQLPTAEEAQKILNQINQE